MHEKTTGRIACTPAFHSIRCRFAARLDSGITPHGRQCAGFLHPSLHHRHRPAAVAIHPMAFRAWAECATAVAASHFQQYRCICLGGRPRFGHRGRCFRTRRGSQARNEPALGAAVVSRYRPFIGVAAFSVPAGAPPFDSRAKGFIRPYATSRTRLIHAPRPMRKNALATSSALAALLLLSGTASAACLEYSPVTSTLTGNLQRITFPGRPNFESIESGDEAETGFYLALTQPLCTFQGAEPDRGAPVENVRLVQLILDQARYDRLGPLLGRTVVLRGTLVPAHTGHHHAPLLLDDVTLVKSRNPR